MTPYIMKQLQFLCEHPDIFCEAVEYWDFKPERERESIRRILKPIYLDKLLINPRLTRGTIFGSQGTVLSFKTRQDPHEYIIFGILDQDDSVHVGLAQKNLPSEAPN